MRNISSWGRLSSHLHKVLSLNDPSTVAKLIAKFNPGIAHGMGRSYGDVCLNPDGVLWNTLGLDNLIQFNENTGQLICEAGVLLRDIQQLVVPRGWMLPVTPGTQLITVGGAIANDVHGKNHHIQGTFGNHVTMLKLQRTDGEIINCGPQVKADWFAASVGGLGLTGVILETEIQLCRVPGPWLSTEMLPYTSLEEFIQLADSSEIDWEHTASWIDCLSVSKRSRGLFLRGNHVNVEHGPMVKNKKLSVPFVPAISLMNRLTRYLINQAYFNLKKRQTGIKVMHYEPFFYPLDDLLFWNRIYGPKGFFQYQSVVPREVGQDAVQQMLNEVKKAKDGSFLSVLKTFGNRESVGMMSFPRSGVTLALDFANRGERTLKLFERLDTIVLEAKGRIYMAKDTRMPRYLFESGYPRLHEFLKYRDPGISSKLSRRLIGS